MQAGKGLRSVPKKNKVNKIKQHREGKKRKEKKKPFFILVSCTGLSLVKKDTFFTLFPLRYHLEYYFSNCQHSAL